MPNLNKKPRRPRIAGNVGVLVLALFLALPGAGAQGQGKSNTGASAPSSAGSSSASNRGGAGGISNPSPGGDPGQIGGPNQSSGPEGTESSRSGYIGGRSTEPVPPPQPPGADTNIVALTAGQFGKCPVVGAEAPSVPQARMSGSNGGRIDIVAQYLNQGQQTQNLSTARYLLANMQEELEKPRPDVTLVGTYLGIASAMPITPALAADVGESLCLPLRSDVAEELGRIAEIQRRKISQNR